MSLAPRASQRAFTLVEVLMATTVTSVLMLTAMTFFAMLWRAEQHGRQNLADAHTLARLARQFRDDIHAANSVSDPQDNASAPLELHLPERMTVDYAISPGGLLRTERLGADVRRREDYRLPESRQVRWNVTGEGSLTLVGLSLLPSDEVARRGTTRIWRVEAMLNPDMMVGIMP